jgi:hypothetical protein
MPTAAACALSVYEADSQDAVEQEFERVGFPWDEIHEVHVDLDDTALNAATAQAGGQ